MKTRFFIVLESQQEKNNLLKALGMLERFLTLEAHKRVRETPDIYKVREQHRWMRHYKNVERLVTRIFQTRGFQKESPIEAAFRAGFKAADTCKCPQCESQALTDFRSKS